MPPSPDILGLEWNDARERHIEEHIDPWEVEEMIEWNDFLAFPNPPGHPPRRLKLVGPTESGRFVTAIVEEPIPFDASAWIPVTAWRSTSVEQETYEAEFRRLGRRRRR